MFPRAGIFPIQLLLMNLPLLVSGVEKKHSFMSYGKIDRERLSLVNGTTDGR